RRRPGASATARSSSRRSIPRSAFAPAKRTRTRSRLSRLPTPGPSRRREGRNETLPQAGGEESNEIPPRTGGTNKEDDMASASDIVKRIKDEEIEWVDLRFTDPKGKWQHLTMVASILDEDTLEEGLMFDGSSIAGWKTINESDMILKPDLEEVWMDPFSATPMMIVVCDIVEPSTGELYARDPRSTATRSEAYLKSTGIGDTVYVGPEAEFFMFDDVRFEDGYAGSGFQIDDIELPTNTGAELEGGNLAHRPRAKGGYFPVAPVDSAVDIRGEMVSTMLEMGLPCDKHHHEVAAAQHELGLTFGTLVQTADRMQIYKYVVHQ